MKADITWRFDSQFVYIDIGWFTVKGYCPQRDLGRAQSLNARRMYLRAQLSDAEIRGDFEIADAIHYEMARIH